MFDVDIEEGSPPLKLPYNADEDPWFAAQKFIHDNNLSQLYLDQVANFIMNNSKQHVSSGAGPANAEFCDPFTGERIMYKSHGKESTKVRITDKMGKLLPKNEEISGGKAHANTRKLI